MKIAPVLRINKSDYVIVCPLLFEIIKNPCWKRCLGNGLLSASKQKENEFVLIKKKKKKGVTKRKRISFFFRKLKETTFKGA